MVLVTASASLGRSSSWPGNEAHFQKAAQERREARRTTASPLVPRQVLIRAHQEQLDEMAKLGFKEETLMSQLAPNVSGLGRTLRGCWELACS